MNYWNKEEPVVVKTAKNTFKFYEEAQKLQVALPDWEKNGMLFAGKTVMIDVKALRANPDAVELFKNLMK